MEQSLETQKITTPLRGHKQRVKCNSDLNGEEDRGVLCLLPADRQAVKKTSLETDMRCILISGHIAASR